MSFVCSLSRFRVVKMVGERNPLKRHVVTSLFTDMMGASGLRAAEHSNSWIHVLGVTWGVYVLSYVVYLMSVASDIRQTSMLPIY